MDSSGGNMRDHLTINMREEKMSYDNPGMVYDAHPSSMQLKKISNVGYPDKNLESRRPVYMPSQNNGIQTTKSEKEYEPYDNRVVEHPTTFFETLIHMLKASLGTGILAMPEAFRNAGYAVATIGTIAIGFLCTYSIHILIKSEYELCKRKKVPSMTYPATAEASVLEGPKSLRGIAPAVPHICNMALLLYQIGSCCIYVVFISRNIKDVCDFYFPEHILDIKYYMLILLLPLIFINWVRNLKYLAPLSSIANVVTLLSFAIIFYYMFDDVPPMSSRNPVTNDINGLPLFFGTVLFAMEAVGVIMPLENEMKNPRRFGNPLGVLNCAMVPITLLYTFIGFFGYLKYGDAVQGAITLSLPKHEKLAQAARLMLAFAIFITHALACYVAFDISWKEYFQPMVKQWKTIGEYLVRTGLVLVTVILAAMIPYLELFIALMGALCLSMMGLAFPALIQLFTYWYYYDGPRFVFFFLKNCTIVCIALLGFVIGTYTSVVAIIEQIGKDHTS